MHAKIKTIITLSVVNIIMPFLGFPIVWKIWITAFLSLIVLILAYKLLHYHDTPNNKHKEPKNSEPVYIETGSKIKEMEKIEKADEQTENYNPARNSESHTV